PGIGGSTSVPTQKRVSVWLEATPALLKHLAIAHVVPVSHNAGTVYLLNLLSQRRDLLWPKAPMAVLLAPWAEPKHSDVLSLQVAQMLPTGAFDYWNKLMQFVATKAAPSFGASTGVVTKMVNSLPRTSKDSSTDEDGLYLTAYGFEMGAVKALDRLAMEYVFLESTTGVNEEAVLCLKKGMPGLWGACEDLPVYIRALVEAEERHKQTHPDEQALNIQVFFAETDTMIGLKGQKYFEDCFEQAHLKDVVSFESSMEKGTDHDSIWASEMGVFKKMLTGIQGGLHSV
ncbi:hypothetical protein BO71DRAFT_333882, partial [Aspergillus ellipticus CBS 707.79]